MFQKKSRHEILGLQQGVDEAEVKAAYRKLAHEFHPDKTGGDDTRFKEINEAYRSLMEQFKRQKKRQEDSEYFYSDFFKSGKANPPPPREPDYPDDERFVVATLHLSIAEIKDGKSIPLTYYTSVPCDQCSSRIMPVDCLQCRGKRTVTKVHNITAYVKGS